MRSINLLSFIAAFFPKQKEECRTIIPYISPPSFPSFTKRQLNRHARWLRQYGKAAKTVLHALKPYDESQKLKVKSQIAHEKERELTERLGKPALDLLVDHFQKKKNLKDFLWISQSIEIFLDTLSPVSLEALREIGSKEDKELAAKNLLLLNEIRDQVDEKTQFDRMMKSYFFSYLDGSVTLDKEFLLRVHRRIVKGEEINERIGLILDLPNYSKTQEKLPELVRYALEDQIACNRFLQKLQKLNFYRKLEKEAKETLQKHLLESGSKQMILEKEEFLEELRKKKQLLEKEIETPPPLRQILVDALKMWKDFRRELDTQPIIDRVFEIDRILFENRGVSEKQRKELEVEKEVRMIQLREALELVDLEKQGAFERRQERKLKPKEWRAALLQSFLERKEFFEKLHSKKFDIETTSALRQSAIDALEMWKQYHSELGTPSIRIRILEIDQILLKNKELPCEQLKAEKEELITQNREALEDLEELVAFEETLEGWLTAIDAQEGASTNFRIARQAILGPLLSKLQMISNNSQEPLGLLKAWDNNLRILLLEEPIDPPSHLHPHFKHIDVCPLNFEGEKILTPQKGKWAVIDTTRCPNISDEAKKTLFTAEMLDHFLGNKKPGEVVSFGYKKGKLIPLPHKRGPIRIFYESPEQVLQAENLDFGQRRRLVEKKRSWFGGFSQPENLQLGDVYRAIKDPRGIRQHWSEDRIRTAAVDRLEVIGMTRTLASAILSGRSIDLNTFQHASEFLAVTYASDLAKLPESYGDDPVFKQAQYFWGAISEPLVQQIREQAELDFLKRDLTAKRERSFHPEASAKALLESFDSLKEWHGQIEKFVDLYDDIPVTLDIFSWYAEELREKISQIRPLIRKSEEVFEQLREEKGSSVKTIQAALDQFIEMTQKLTPIVHSLAVPEASRLLKEHRRALLEKLGKKHAKDQQRLVIQEFGKTADFVFPPFFQKLSRHKLIAEALAKNSSELGALWWKIFSAHSTTIQEVQKSERLRMDAIREMRSQKTSPINRYYRSLISPQKTV